MQHKIIIYSYDGATLSKVSAAVRAVANSCAAIEARWFDGSTEKTARVAYLYTGRKEDTDMFDKIAKAYASKGLELEAVTWEDDADAVAAFLFPDPDKADDPAPEDDAPPPPLTAKEERAAARAAKLKAAEAKAAEAPPIKPPDATEAEAAKE
jgi:hypothetical protein